MKNLIIAIALLMTSSVLSQDKGKVKGVVTYFFNEHIGTKADIGATILIHKKEESDTLHDILKKHKTNEVMYLSYLQISRSINSKAIIDKMTKSRSDYKSTELLAKNYISEIELNNSTIKLTADGSGNYSHDLPIGSYQIIVISKNSGYRINSRIIQIKKEEATIADFDFGRV